MRSLQYLAASVTIVVATSAAPTLAHAQTQAKAQSANPAAEHLTAARAALNKVLNSPAPTGDAFKKLAELKTEYIAMEKAASTASPQWKTHYETINKLLTDLVGAPNAAEPGAVGTSGSAGAPMAAALTANLLDFRTHLTAFSAAMGNVAPAAGAAAAPASAPAAPAASAPAPATPAPATPPPATEPPATAPPATAPAATAEPASADAAAQLDQVVGMIEGVLKANADATGTVSMQRSMLEQMKTQLEQIRASVKKQ
jgi:acyl-CoA synthetase (AMP-forming)/AMP-acid ligase II